MTSQDLKTSFLRSPSESSEYCVCRHVVLVVHQVWLQTDDGIRLAVRPPHHVSVDPAFESSSAMLLGQFARHPSNQKQLLLHHVLFLQVATWVARYRSLCGFFLDFRFRSWLSVAVRLRTDTVDGTNLVLGCLKVRVYKCKSTSRHTRKNKSIHR